MSRRGVLQGLGLAGLVGLGAGTASADEPRGVVGSTDHPVDTLYLDTLSGTLTDDADLTTLDGEGLAIENGALEVEPTGPTVADSGQVVAEEAELLSFDDNIDVTDNGDGSATVDANFRGAIKWAETDTDGLLETVSPYAGIEVADVRTENLSGTVTGGADVSTLADDGLEIASGELRTASERIAVENSGLSVYLGATQRIASGSPSTVVFDEVNVDDFGGYDANTGTYTIQESGDYHVSFTIDWQTNFSAGVNVDYELLVNGATDGGIQADTKTAILNHRVCRNYSRTLFDLQVGDTVEVRVAQDSGGPADLYGNGQETYMTIHKVG